MNKQITSASELAEKIEAKRYDYFTFPILDITVKYRKPDLLKLSFNNSLPVAMANAVISAYREAVGGTTPEEFVEKSSEQSLKIDDELVQDLSVKGYNLLKELVVSYKILDVPQSDVETGVLSYNDIPEEDAIAFLMHLIQQAQTAKTVTGGEITSEDVTDFPGGKRSTKRRTASQNG